MFVQILFLTASPALAAQYVKNVMQTIISILVTAFPVLLVSKDAHNVPSKGALSARKDTI